jgi:hypothetical protein
MTSTCRGTPGGREERGGERRTILAVIALRACHLSLSPLSLRTSVANQERGSQEVVAVDGVVHKQLGGDHRVHEFSVEHITIAASRPAQSAITGRCG